MDGIVALLIFAGLVGVVWILGQVRAAAEDAVGSAITKGVVAVRGPQAKTWRIAPGPGGAAALASALQKHRDDDRSFGGTTFTVGVGSDDDVVVCQTPPGLDSAAVQKAVMLTARQVDEACQIRL